MSEPNEHKHERKDYATDLTDAEWAKLEPLIPAPKPGGRPAKYPRREIVNAILYLLRSGCSWRLLPHDLPPWRIVYWYFFHWRNEGLFERINDALRKEVRTQAGRNPEPSGGVVDTQTVKTTEKGGLQTIEGTMQPRS
jgi:putative transposase